MATKHTLKGLLVHLLAPVTDAIQAETGKKISTAGWGRVVRTVAAHGLRLLAGLVEPDATPEPVAVQAPAPVVEPVAVEPEPAPVPFGWDSLDLPHVETAPEPAPVVPVGQPAKTTNRVRKVPANGKVPARKKTAPAPAKAWTVAEIATRLDTQPRAVRKWIAAGRLTATQTGKVWTVADADLSAFLATLDGGKATKGKAVAV